MTDISSRRALLQAALLAALAPRSSRACSAAGATSAPRLALAWIETAEPVESRPAAPSASAATTAAIPAASATAQPTLDRYCLGSLSLAAGSDARAAPLTRIELPSRAHGLCRDHAGHVLTVARRPGLWLMRWDPRDGETLQQRWAEPGQQYNGHVLCPGVTGAPMVLTTELDAAGDQGYVVRRDARTLAALDAWPTHGTDPHQMLQVGHRLFVANGGIRTRPETGRAKHELNRMDASLVALDLRPGRTQGCLLGQWRLPDARLSIRHLAWHAPSRTLGIALQAEHDDAADKLRAPVLALFDGSALRTAASPPLAGYGGDVASACAGWVVSAPRHQGGALGCWSASGQWRGCIPLPDACALAAAGPDVLAAGTRTGLRAAASGNAMPPTTALALARPDNHWLLL